MKKILLGLMMMMSSIAAFAENNKHLFACSPVGQAQMFYIATNTFKNSASLNQFIAKKISELGMNCSEVNIEQIPSENAEYSINYNFKPQCGTRSGTSLIDKLSEKYTHAVGYVITLSYADSRNDQPLTITIDKDTMVFTANRFSAYDRLAEKQVKLGLKKIINEISRDQNQN